MPLGWFRKKKKDEPDEEIRDQAQELAYALTRTPESEINPGTRSPNPTPSKPTTSYKTFSQWLGQVLLTTDIMEKSKALGDISMQFYSGGTPFYVSKQGVGSLTLAMGRQVKNDVVITISDLAEKKLIGMSNFDDFAASYRKLASNPRPQEYVKIKLMDDLSELRKKGYFRLKLLRTLIQA
ncbi:MAG: hypothetical protein ACFE7E_00045 [Candidatus Hodarchaeota archaeon]